MKLQTWHDQSQQKMSININYKKNCKMDNLYILLAFLLMTILLFIIIGVYYYFYHLKHASKQEQILQYYNSNIKLKEINVTNIT